MNFLDRVYFDNDVRSYITTAIVILLAIILKRIISTYAATLLFKIGKAQWRGMDQHKFDNIIVVPLERIMVVMITVFAMDRLTFPSALLFYIHKTSSKEIVETIASAVIIICLVSLALRFLEFLVQVIKHKSFNKGTTSEYQLLFFFKDFIRVIIIIFGIIFILKYSFHQDIGNLLTGLSIVGAALALAARESLENLIASFIIFFDKPFETGDLVQVKDVKGNVERIGLRSTRIRTVEKSLVTVPNKQMVDSILDNYSSRNLVRNELLTQLPPLTSAADIERILQGIKKMLGDDKRVFTFSVFLKEITKDTVNILAVYFTGMDLPADELSLIRQQIYIGIRKLQEANTRPAGM